jgi:hypothetical protein
MTEFDPQGQFWDNSCGGSFAFVGACMRAGRVHVCVRVYSMRAHSLSMQALALRASGHGRRASARRATHTRASGAGFDCTSHDGSRPGSCGGVWAGHWLHASQPADMTQVFSVPALDLRRH